MSNTLSNRADCVQEIRRLVADDAFAARYALLAALHRLDLAGVNEVLDVLSEWVEELETPRQPLLDQVLKERWG